MSMTLLEQMKSSISQQSIGYAAKLLGESAANIEKAVTMAVPALMSAITAAAHIPSGTAGQSVVSRLVSDPVNDGSLLHRLPALYQGTMTASPVYRLGTQLLQAIFGAKLGKFTQTVAALSGIKPASAALLVNTLVPHIMAVVGKRHRLCGDATPQGLINLLDTEHAAVKAAIPTALADLIPAAAKVATADALKASAKPVGKSPAQPAAKPVSATTEATSQPVHTTVPRREPSAKPPVVTKQSYRWGSWLPVIALYGAGAVALAVFLTPPTEVPTGQPDVAAPAAPAQTNPAQIKTADVKPSPTKPTEIKASETKAPEIKTAEVKSAEVKSAEVKSAVAVTGPETKPSSAAQSDAKPAVKKTDGPATPAPGKVAEVAKTAAAPADAAPPVATKAPPTLTAAGASDVPAQANPYKPPVGVNRPLADASKTSAAAETTKTTAAAESAKTAETAKAPAAAPQPPAGTTSYFGAATGPVIDTTAKMNPDYRPAQPAAPLAKSAASTDKPSAAAPDAQVRQAGTTSYFGAATGPVIDTTAKMNPDYRPAQPASAPDAAPAPAKAADASAPTPAPAKTTIVVQPPPARGTTSFFGITPPVAEAPAKPNPDYKPAATTTAAAPPAPEVPAKPAEPATPSLASQALSVVKSLIAPAPPRPPGVTSYFGTTPPVPEATARANPDYVPTKPATGDATPDATPTAATPKASTALAAPAANVPSAAPAAATAPITATAAGQCRASIDKAMGGGRIAFQSAKADLRKSSLAALDRISSAFKACPSVRLTVEGHTDNTGQAEMNEKLSLARAQTVTDYLVSKGVDAARVTPTGLGSARPLAPNTSAINKARNRRIEFAVSDL